MPTLYVTEQGARIEREYRRLLVVKGDEALLALPLARIDHLVLVGRVGMTTPAMHALLDADVGVSLLNRWGRLRGRLVPPTGKNIPLRQCQYARALDNKFCLAVSRSVVEGKLRNYRALAQRWARRRTGIGHEAVTEIGAALEQLVTASDLAVLRGIEGRGSRAYFRLWWRLLPVTLSHSCRSRRPPRDPANALMSLGYSLLAQNMMTACEVVGLDPYDGFFHADKYGRPALALDLMEEFRGVIVDSVVINLLNRRRLDADDFRPGPEGGIYLKERGLRVFFDAYGKRLNRQVVHPLAGRRLSYQKCFEVQARLMRRTIEKSSEGSNERYMPFRTR